MFYRATSQRRQRATCAIFLAVWFNGNSANSAAVTHRQCAGNRVLPTVFASRT